jgi:hypothetical protein
MLISLRATALSTSKILAIHLLQISSILITIKGLLKFKRFKRIKDIISTNISRTSIAYINMMPSSPFFQHSVTNASHAPPKTQDI